MSGFARTNPPAAADEATMLLSFVDYFRATILRQAEGLSAAQLATPLPPATMTLAEVRALTGDKESLQQYVDIGLVEIKGAKALVKRPELLRAFGEMRGFGMPTEALIRLHSEVAMSVDDITRALVNEAVRQVRGTSVNQVAGARHVLVTAGTGVPTSGLVLGPAG